MFSAKLCEWGIGLLTLANTGYTFEVAFSAICDQWGIHGHSQCSQYKLRPLEGTKCDRRDFICQKKTRALNKEEYRLIIDCIKKDFDMPGGTAVKMQIPESLWHYNAKRYWDFVSVIFSA